MECYFKKYYSPIEWLFQEDKIDPALQSMNESLFTLGNGFLGSRGIFEETPVNSLPGTFFAGIFDEAESKVSELVNAPNPFYFSVELSSKEKLDLTTIPLEYHERVLDLRKGFLARHTIFNTQQNKIDYQSMRFISNHQTNIAAMQIALTPLLQEENFCINTAIDTSVKNKGIVLEENLRKFIITQQENSDNRQYLYVDTLDGKKEIAYGQEIILVIDGKSQIINDNNFEFKLVKNQTAFITKTIILQARKKRVGDIPFQQVIQHALQQVSSGGFEHLFQEHIQIFDKKWQQGEITLIGDTDIQAALRFTIYHLLIGYHENLSDVSIGAKMLSGEGYKGHIFWETELLLLPYYLSLNPLLGKNLLDFRCRRLAAAKKIASERGYKGALFPWESADTGSDETPPWSQDLDATIKIVHTGKQSTHINVAIFYGMYHYFLLTQDIDFMVTRGLELAIELARFWKSRVAHNKKSKLYKIKRVMGPDEFHENINNNAYTNQLVAWSLQKTILFIEMFQKSHPEEIKILFNKLKFYQREISKIKKVSENMWVPTKDNLVLQFDNYDKLKFTRTPSLDIFGLPNLPPDILLADLNRTQFIKQADVILLLLLLPSYFEQKAKENNFHYYEARTLHKSSWSPPIYSAVAAQLNFEERAYHYLNVSLNTDKKNIFNNTEDGLHTPALGGALLALLYGFCGIRVAEDRLIINPKIPKLWQSISLNYVYLDFVANMTISQQELKIVLRHGDWPWLTQQLGRKIFQAGCIEVNNQRFELMPNKEYIIPLSKS